MRPHAEIVGMDMIAGGDGLGRGTDDLTIADHPAADRDRREGDLVTARDGAGKSDTVFRQEAVRRQVGQGDDDIVGRMEPERPGGSGVEHGHPPETDRQAC
ncbi:hypothetical protein ruthe_00826 [Rubellimicrobium thermophilum DSM 16684]|uniref:Uncharacterized protein n=1 Tax=Rubellimicrobium thermophilum DSM 16684 TaxID=1123069 RepID=S9SAI7_9RHOB|nr:hypothetical protein ruthe_00826 [Rubellimicrobium thermophilum DSM 16684]